MCGRTGVIALDFLKFMVMRRRFYGSVIFLLCLFGLIMEGGFTWRFWGLIISLCVFVSVEFTTWFLNAENKGEPDRSD
jgi:hypothetical protein